MAAEFVMKRVPGCTVTPWVCHAYIIPLNCSHLPSYHGKIQDHPTSFYSTFDVIVAGLDSISARRWINATLVQMAQEGEENIKPLIDGGTEGNSAHLNKRLHGADH